MRNNGNGSRGNFREIFSLVRSQSATDLGVCKQLDMFMVINVVDTVIMIIMIICSNGNNGYEDMDRD